MFTFLLLVAAPEPVPTFKVENKMPAFTVVNRIPASEPAPTREYWGGSWGWVERGPDGVYRQVSGSGGAAAPTFRGDRYNASHTCPECGRSQFVVSGSRPGGGHYHTCAAGHTWWH